MPFIRLKKEPGKENNANAQVVDRRCKRKKPRKQKTCLTLKELARAFPDIAQQVCFHLKQLTYKSLVSRFPTSKHKVAQ